MGPSAWKRSCPAVSWSRRGAEVKVAAVGVSRGREGWTRVEAAATAGRESGCGTSARPNSERDGGAAVQHNSFAQVRGLHVGRSPRVSEADSGKRRARDEDANRVCPAPEGKASVARYFWRRTRRARRGGGAVVCRGESVRSRRSASGALVWGRRAWMVAGCASLNTFVT